MDLLRDFLFVGMRLAMPFWRKPIIDGLRPCVPSLMLWSSRTRLRVGVGVLLRASGAACVLGRIVRLPCLGCQQAVAIVFGRLRSVLVVRKNMANARRHAMQEGTHRLAAKGPVLCLLTHFPQAAIDHSLQEGLLLCAWPP